MSDRAIEMLNLKEDEPAYILDVGCGSGLSGECLDEQVRFLQFYIYVTTITGTHMGRNGYFTRDAGHSD